MAKDEWGERGANPVKGHEGDRQEVGKQPRISINGMRGGTFSSLESFVNNCKRKVKVGRPQLGARWGKIHRRGEVRLSVSGFFGLDRKK